MRFSLIIMISIVGGTVYGAALEKKQKNMSFQGMGVEGKYHLSDEAVVTVENEKVLNALFKLKTNYKNRIKKAIK